MPEDLNPDTNFRIISKRSPETQARKAQMPTGDRRKIYLASSWRNAWQPAAVKGLRAAGHEVYDFQNPAPGNKGFAWSEIDPDWLQWNPTRFVSALEDPIALSGYRFDKAALDWCDTCVLLLPCGRSAHLEAGYAIGQGKPTLVVLAEDRFEPELMYLLADVVVSDLGQMIPAVDRLPRQNRRTPEPGTSVVRWVRYNGDLESLPEPGKRAWLCGSRGIYPRVIIGYDAEAEYWYLCPDGIINMVEGDRWAYLPEPPAEER